MKKIFFLIGFLSGACVFSQVAIGKDTVEGTSTILDFGTANMGIVLPIVDKTITPAVTPSNGTFILDKTSKKVQVYQNGAWLDLSDEGSFAVVKNADNTIELTTAAQISTSNEVSDGVIIGDTSSTAKGVLVLESTNKAMILPKVANPHLTIKKPVAGTMCYDTVSNSLAIFDGKVWSYWK